MEQRTVVDASGIGASISRIANHGIVSEDGSGFVQVWPSLNPDYPCGAVHSGIWRFTAPEKFIIALHQSTAYGGRFQYRWDDLRHRAFSQASRTANILYARTNCALDQRRALLLFSRIRRAWLTLKNSTLFEDEAGRRLTDMCIYIHSSQS